MTPILNNNTNATTTTATTSNNTDHTATLRLRHDVRTTRTNLRRFHHAHPGPERPRNVHSWGLPQAPRAAPQKGGHRSQPRGARSRQRLLRPDSLAPGPPSSPTRPQPDGAPPLSGAEQGALLESVLQVGTTLERGGGRGEDEAAEGTRNKGGVKRGHGDGTKLFFWRKKGGYCSRPWVARAEGRGGLMENYVNSVLQLQATFQLRFV